MRSALTPTLWLTWMAICPHRGGEPSVPIEGWSHLSPWGGAICPHRGGNLPCDTFLSPLARLDGEAPKGQLAARTTGRRAGAHHRPNSVPQIHTLRPSPRDLRT